MMKDKRSILTIILIILVFVLGGVAIYLATRVSVPTPIAPTAPVSEPAAAVSCSAEGGVCRTSTTPNCTVGETQIAANDCADGQICCVGAWAACSALNFNIACTPRPACLDEKPACSIPAEPTGGWCPAYVCEGGKEIYRNDPRNIPGSYYFLDKISDGGTVYQGEILVIDIKFSNKSSKIIESAQIVDVLDPRLTFMDTVPNCSYTASNSTVKCNVGSFEPNTTGAFPFRVRVKSTASVGELNNKAVIKTNQGSENICYSQNVIQPEPIADVTCISKKALASVSATEDLKETTAGANYIYSFEIENKGTASSSGYVLKDVLQADSKVKLDFIDSPDGCTFSSESKTVLCPLALAAGASKKISFKVGVSEEAIDGSVIKNSGNVYKSVTASSAISTCTNNITVKNPIIGAAKKAYKDVSTNTAGNYTLSQEIATIARGETFVYNINVQNKGMGDATGVVITDALNGQGQENLSFVDSHSECSYTASSRTVSCTVGVTAGTNKNVSFRVKVNETVPNETVIKNVGLVKLGKQEITVTKDLKTSSIIVTPTATPIITAAPTTIVITAAPTAVVTAAPTAVITKAPAAVVTAAPEVLPETGIFDMPGVAAFGGGMLLAILGIILAL